MQLLSRNEKQKPKQDTEFCHKNCIQRPAISVVGMSLSKLRTHNQARSPAGYYFYSPRRVSVAHCGVVLLKPRRQWDLEQNTISIHLQSFLRFFCLSEML